MPKNPKRLPKEPKSQGNLGSFGRRFGAYWNVKGYLLENRFVWMKVCDVKFIQS